jgi:hypothetical protein
VKKDKQQKPIEEVIDVVGDFGPAKNEPMQTSVIDESFGMNFDMSGIAPVDQTQMQDQSIQPELGELKINIC